MSCFLEGNFGTVAFPLSLSELSATTETRDILPQAHLDHLPEEHLQLGVVRPYCIFLFFYFVHAHCEPLQNS